MKKVTILVLSICPSFYDNGADMIKRISKMSYDEAKSYMDKLKEDDEINAWTMQEIEVDMSKPNETFFCCDGVESGDSTDTMLSWIKVWEK